MTTAVRYTVFETRWGYFGLAGAGAGLLRTCLPMPNASRVESLLLENHPSARHEKGLFRPLQEQITAYFQGSYVDFDADMPVLFMDLSSFARSVLAACRGVRYGRTISYGQLAAKAGSPKAARAIGGVMARNPLPLIIPCHRIVRADGRIGGFSAIGGISLKKKMLEMESHALKV
ncbi:MAG: methylated-DNA--[protein]-cysteine S-methyltransferase [Planctomycetota bacterium]|jgi:methylated-DNA-[protein]-cysteine S-methyltransferase